MTGGKVLCGYCNLEVDGTIFVHEDRKVCEECFADYTSFDNVQDTNAVKIDKVKLHQEICEKLNKIYQQKNADYGDSFAKARKEVPNYTLGKLYDKFERFKQLSKHENQVKDESIIDTLYDLANYAILELIERGLDNE